MSRINLYFAGQGKYFFADGAKQFAAVSRRKIRSSNRFHKYRITAKQHLFILRVIAAAALCMSRRMDDLKRQASNRNCLSIAQQNIGLQSHFVSHHNAAIQLRIYQQLFLLLKSIHFTARRGHQITYRRNVVKMSMRQQNALQSEISLFHIAGNFIGLIAGVNDKTGLAPLFFYYITISINRPYRQYRYFHRFLPSQTSALSVRTTLDVRHTFNRTEFRHQSV